MIRRMIKVIAPAAIALIVIGCGGAGQKQGESSKQNNPPAAARDTTQTTTTTTTTRTDTTAYSGTTTQSGTGTQSTGTTQTPSGMPPGGQPSGTPQQPGATQQPSATQTPGAAGAGLPDTTAASVWSYLEKVSYATWSVWPGRGPFAPGKAPHGALVTAYVNPVALDAINRKTGTLPPGSIIVMENYDAAKKLIATTIKYKVPGYDAQHNDWFWMRRTPDGNSTAGKLRTCQGCHGQQAANDYIWTAPLK